MKKIILQNMISLDGFIAGADDNIDWHTVDDEFNKYAISVHNSIDTIIFGRKTYQLFEGYWPGELDSPNTSDDDRHIAQSIHDATKIVFSKTLENVTWNNSVLKKEINADEIKQLKEGKGKDIMIYGSGTIVSELAKLGLIDEYRFMISPVVLGKGKGQFETVDHNLKLKLENTRIFGNGNVLLTYIPI